MTETKRRTVGTMDIGDVAYVYPSDVKTQGIFDNYWLHPDRPVYNAPSLGAQIERTEAGYIVLIDRGKGSRTLWREATSPERAGYVQATRVRTY